MAKRENEILDEAERLLRDLLAESAARGDYEEVLRLTDLARRLRDLGQNPRNNGTPANPAPAVVYVPPSADAGGSSRRRRAPMPRAAHGGKRRAKKGDYPRFFRRGDDLVKIGWSKKEKSEYQHKAPRRVIDALAAAISRHAGNGRLFTVDDLVPLKDQDGSELPAYQVYVALAWFKSGGVVRQHGRSGYSANCGGRVAEKASTLWKTLVESPGPISG